MVEQGQEHGRAFRHKYVANKKGTPFSAVCEELKKHSPPYPPPTKPSILTKMDREKLMKMATAVRTGGKGSVRRRRLSTRLILQMIKGFRAP
uniref:Uncharacterized protein n=1 Tax=Salix viminalis TaxID=40686 RepID=A0A6N2LMI0_SALVM